MLGYTQAERDELPRDPWVCRRILSEGSLYKVAEISSIKKGLHMAKKPIPHIDNLKIKLAAAYCYLLINHQGLCYLGATNNLVRRLREHNEGKNKTAWTADKGPWHLLTYKRFNSAEEAFAYEALLKADWHLKNQWKCRHIKKAREIADKYKYSIFPEDWANPIEAKKQPTLKELLTFKKILGW